MTGRANFDLKGVIGKGGFRFETIATAAGYRNFVVGGMNVGFHGTRFLGFSCEGANVGGNASISSYKPNPNERPFASASSNEGRRECASLDLA